MPLLMVLAAEAEGSACWLSQAELASRLVLHVSNVRRQEQILEQLGIVRIVRGGSNNRRLIILEDLDAQAVDADRRSRANPNAPEGHRGGNPVTSHDAEPCRRSGSDSPLVGSAAAVGQSLGSAPPAQPEARSPLSTGSRHSSPETVRPCAVSSARQTAHETALHKGIAGACARVEEPLSDSSERRPPKAPWTPWRSRDAAVAAGCRGARMPEWEGPSRAVDERARALHSRLAMWPNTLREVVILARDLARIRGQEEALTYLEALERHALTQRRPGGCALGALRRRTRLPARTERVRQHVLEDVGRARHVAGLLERVMQGVRHA